VSTRDINNIKNRLEASVWLTETIGWGPFKYLPADCRKLVYDWIGLVKVGNSSQDEFRFYDYSFFMAPMYKAVEGVLWKISEDLRLVKEGQPLGNFFDETSIEKNLSKLETKIGVKIDDREKIKLVKRELLELKDFLMRYRHNPAHFGNIFDTYQKVELAGYSALHNIRCLLDDLIETKVISLPKETVGSNIGEIDIDSIPF